MKDDGPPIKVYLIDDHKSVLWGLKKLIESVSPKMCLVGQSTKWTEALSQLTNVKPDVILLDLDLGEEDGLDAIPEIVAQGVGKILVLTGMRDPAKHDQAVVLGARGVVEKEDSADTILTAIAKVHGGHIWLPRLAIDRILAELSKKDIPPKLSPEQEKIASLTARERAIVEAVANNANANARMLASMLFISEYTLRNHLTSIYLKLGVSSRLELFAFAHNNGLACRIAQQGHRA